VVVRVPDSLFLPPSPDDAVRHLFLFLTFAALSAFFVGCDTGTSGGSSPTGTAELRFVHAAPDVGTVSIVVNGDTIASDVDFEVGSPVPAPPTTEYVDVPTGVNNLVQVQSQSGTILIEQQTGTSFLEPDQQYTVVFARLPAQGTIGGIIFPDQFPTLESGEYGFRTIHASSAVESTYGAVDLHFQPPSDSITPITSLVSRIAFADDTGSRLQEGFGGFTVNTVPSDTVALSITDDGETDVLYQQVFGPSTDVPVSDGDYVTTLIANVPAGSGRVEGGVLVIRE